MRPECPWPVATKIAHQVAAILRPACNRIEIGGSIRRRCPYVKDIELVAEPRTTPIRDLFGEIIAYHNALNVLLADNQVTGPSGPLAWDPALRRNGDRYKRLLDPPTAIPIDLFIVLPPAQWGLILMIRTGSGTKERGGTTIEGFAPAMLRRWKQVTNGGYSQDGRLHLADGTPVPTPDERSVFAACQVLYREPHERTDRNAIVTLIQDKAAVTAALKGRAP